MGFTMAFMAASSPWHFMQPMGAARDSRTAPPNASKPRQTDSKTRRTLMAPLGKVDLNDPGAIAEFIASLVSGIERVGPLPGHYRHP